MATALTLGHYLLEEEIGSGGMGVVYAATDEILGRRVAVKLLRQGALSDDSHRHRFRREAQAASALNHPHIVTIHDIGSSDGDDFIVMEIVEGATLRTTIPPAGLPIEEALRYAIQLTSAVGAAHGAGIVHRDIKPANILLTPDGRVKLADFGLAKVVRDFSEEASTATALTAERGFAGTPGYASPEQIRGVTVDVRTDVFAIGCVLYEMLTGTRAFAPRPGQTAFTAVLENDPVPPRKLRRTIPGDLELILLRALDRSLERRCSSAAELLAGLETVYARLSARRVSLLHAIVRPRVALAAATLIAFAVIAAGMTWKTWRDERWVEDVALPGAAAQNQNGATLAAFRILRRASALRPNDVRIRQALEECSGVIAFTTDPPGADVFLRGFFEPPDAWEHLGRTPLYARVPTGAQIVLFRVVHDGYADHVFLSSGNLKRRHVSLTRTAEMPAGMEAIPGGTQTFFDSEAELDPFWIDRFEVTNRDFQRFVRQGGYESDAFWAGTPPHLRATFVDRTGRPGPSTWAVGQPPEARDDHPVGGVSWYEARAYCRSLGKDLPSFFHWYKAAAPLLSTPFAHESRFSSEESAPVGHPLRINAHGTYDMAGNIREWALNESSPGRRAALGGSFSEESYTYAEHAFEPAQRREAFLGFRCAAYRRPISAAAAAPVRLPFRDYRDETPIGDEAFEVIRGLYNYERRPLEARVELVDDTLPSYRIERASFTAGYGGERLRALLLLPKNASPPYQTVILAPGSAVFWGRQRFEMDGSTTRALFLSRSGRALVLPEYFGAYTRPRASSWRDASLHSVKDVRRTIDYLETRSDIDADHLGYWGFSFGAYLGPLVEAVEPRIRAAVLLGGGFPFYSVAPEADPINFAPHGRVPTLMINGKHDYAFNYETSQKPMFELLGAKEKRHAVFESGHIPSEWNEVIRETLDWYDRHLGPVAVK